MAIFATELEGLHAVMELTALYVATELPGLHAVMELTGLYVAMEFMELTGLYVATELPGLHAVMELAELAGTAQEANAAAEDRASWSRRSSSRTCP